MEYGEHSLPNTLISLAEKAPPTLVARVLLLPVTARPYCSPSTTGTKYTPNTLRSLSLRLLPLFFFHLPLPPLLSHCFQVRPVLAVEYLRCSFSFILQRFASVRCFSKAYPGRQLCVPLRT